MTDVNPIRQKDQPVTVTTPSSESVTVTEEVLTEEDADDPALLAIEKLKLKLESCVDDLERKLAVLDRLGDLLEPSIAEVLDQISEDLINKAA